MNLLLVLFLVFSVLHFLAIGFSNKESLLYLPSKVVPILLLLYGMIRHGKRLPKPGKVFTLGLVFSVFGDSFLALPGKEYFVPGLGSFLIAQLLYAYAFSFGESSFWKRALPFFAFGAAYYALLLPHLGNLSLPVFVYMTAICLMGWRVASASSRPKQSFQLGLMGAILFILSDSIIAYSMFLAPEMNRMLASFLIMSTYYIAQLFLFLSMEPKESI
ncbi:YhhN-like protein [Leptospira ryugenii]|uniref:YhhN-like protein n=1 Tax=Leptospira ryugenii TaxID=1917863 RepID=A0A2P2E4N7_9LEPT|nr:lysoplasmalogenase [Leptospira ryugenii]GBF51847.1 YhhN-like protein [Leptospira ryugenii]